MNLVTIVETPAENRPTPETAAAPGDSAAASTFEAFREYLLRIASRRIRAELRGKISASDVVQETLCEAIRDRFSFTGQSSQDCRRWLGRILRNNLRDAERRFQAARRAAGREVTADRSSILRNLTVSDRPESAVNEREQAASLEAAIARLSPAHREVIILRNRENKRFSEIATQLQVTPEAARKLWGRAIGELRRMLTRPGSA